MDVRERGSRHRVPLPEAARRRSALLLAALAILAGCGDQRARGGEDGPAQAASEPAVAPTSDSTSAAAAADVIRRYYAAIDAGEFRRAYELWGDSGKASGQSYEAFVAGFAETAHVEVEVGTPGRVEGAAGSRFVDVPVVIRAALKDGEHQRFQGHYTLQRVVVPGASPAERRWHLYSAKIEPTSG